VLGSSPCYERLQSVPLLTANDSTLPTGTCDDVITSLSNRQQQPARTNVSVIYLNTATTYNIHYTLWTIKMVAIHLWS